MTETAKTRTAKQRSIGSLAARACRGLSWGVGTAIFTCFLEVIDSFMDGLTDVLFTDET